MTGYKNREYFTNEMKFLGHPGYIVLRKKVVLADRWRLRSPIPFLRSAVLEFHRTLRSLNPTNWLT